MRKYLLSAVAAFLLVTAQAQWQVQNANLINDTLGFYEMSLPDKHTAWAVCYDGKFGLLSGRPVLAFTRTTNGGNTWTPGKVGNDRTLRFSNISAINDREAWVAMHKMDYSTGPTLGYVGFGKGGGVFHTTDGGITWKHTNPGELFANNSTPEFVHFKNKNQGIAVGDPKQGNWEIYLTNNKGKKWKRVRTKDIPAPHANERGWISGYATIGNTIWFGTTAGRMYKSTNFGKKWTVHSIDSTPGIEVNEIAFLDDKLHGIAHLRNNSISRTYVFSTSDGGLTWTNYFQPANWKNSRVTAVPGTNAFVSTAVHGNPIFQGSAVSYDAGMTWTEIENTASKAVCRFFDARTGYAGGFFLTGPPLRGGLFKSQIVFQQPPKTKNNYHNPPSDNPKHVITEAAISVYPIPAKDFVNVVLPQAFANTVCTISIVSMDGKLMQTRRTNSTNLIQLNTTRILPGVYIVRVASNGVVLNKTITIAK